MSPLKPRFEDANAAELMRWAAQYFVDHAEMIERSHTDVHGRIRPAETRVELKFLRDWIQRAGELTPLELANEGNAGHQGAMQGTGRPWTGPESIPVMLNAGTVRGWPPPPRMDKATHDRLAAEVKRYSPPDPREPRHDPRQPQPDPREKRPPATPKEPVEGMGGDAILDRPL